VAEEVDWICTPSKIEPSFEKIIKYGRHYGINIFAASRFPAEVNILLRSQADEIISFQQTEQGHLEYMAKRGFNPEELKNLEQYKFISITQ
jgi:hypothetical protein